MENVMNNYASSMHNYSFDQKINVAVVGGSGYSGQELLRILKKHPSVNLKGSFNSSNADELNPVEYDVVFLATPAEVSIQLGSKFYQAGTSVIDLSGAFRLEEDDYPKWYNLFHQEAALLNQASYGLIPWMKPKSDRPVLISNPGCYATAILMALLPLLKMDLIEVTSLVIDAKSGTTGAGKKAVESQLFSEVDGECLPYKVGMHQHLPEIKRFAKIISGSLIDPFLSTSLLPTRRGIVAGIYARLKSPNSAQQVEAAFKEFYGAYSFVKLTQEASLKKVVGTAETHIYFKVVGDKLYLFSCLDNLLKGAASQAVENMNLVYHLPVTTGLDHLEALV